MSDAANQAIVYLQQIGYKAGDYTVELKKYDDSTAAAGKWDQCSCTKNAQDHVAESAATRSWSTGSGCAIIIPVANQDPERRDRDALAGQHLRRPDAGGPGTRASRTSTTRPATRNYARVVANDAYQGAAVAEFAQTQGVKSVYILNDKEAYGLGVATNFQNAAESLGIKIAGFEAWDPKASSYEALFKKIKATGADAVFLGGLIDENGAQVIKDKVAVLGRTTAVKLFAPDGFFTSSTPSRLGLGGAAGHVHVASRAFTADDLRAQDGEAATSSTHFKAKYGSRRCSRHSPTPLYGARRCDLNAIAQSDGTRAVGHQAASFGRHHHRERHRRGRSRFGLQGDTNRLEHDQSRSSGTRTPRKSAGDRRLARSQVSRQQVRRAFAGPG